MFLYFVISACQKIIRGYELVNQHWISFYIEIVVPGCRCEQKCKKDRPNVFFWYFVSSARRMPCLLISAGYLHKQAWEWVIWRGIEHWCSQLMHWFRSSTNRLKFFSVLIWASCARNNLPVSYLQDDKMVSNCRFIDFLPKFLIRNVQFVSCMWHDITSKV